MVAKKVKHIKINKAKSISDSTTGFVPTYEITLRATNIANINIRMVRKDEMTKRKSMLNTR
tara:strand:+ start:154 stop:336 length:183 start_codon:yes stop_codon:yes gene_type:complete